MSKPTLLIMAAGMGNRYGGLKQLDGVGPDGETIMDYSVFNAVKSGFGKVVFVIRRSFEIDFRSKVLAKYQNVIPCQVVYQEIDNLPKPFKAPAEREKPWGTGHALLMAEPVINEPFCVINADDYYGSEAFELMANALITLPTDSKGSYFMVSYPLSNTLSESGTVSRGVCNLSSDGLLLGVVEHRKLKKVNNEAIFDEETQMKFPFSTPVSMNFWGFTPDYFAHSKDLFKQFLALHGNELKSEFYIPSVVAKLIEQNIATVRVMQTSENWFGVTYANDRPEVVNRLQRLHQNNTYPTPLF